MICRDIIQIVAYLDGKMRWDRTGQLFGGMICTRARRVSLCHKCSSISYLANLQTVRALDKKGRGWTFYHGNGSDSLSLAPIIIEIVK